MLIRLKSSAEIEGFAEAGKIAATILTAVLAEAKPGTTTGELDELARSMCADNGVKPAFLGYRGFPAAICASVNEEVVHGIPGSRVLEEGDLLSVDVGTDLDGFIGDTAATKDVTFDDSGPFSKMSADCHEALYAAIRVARPGGRLSEIGEVIQGIAKKGKWAIVTKLGGHGLDRGRLHADPFVWNCAMYGFTEDVELRPGMIIAIEPMFVEGKSGEVVMLEDGWTIVAEGRAAHWEHTIAITEDGVRILTLPSCAPEPIEA